MTKEQLTILSQVYNTLLMIETKGENTLIMAECLRALQVVVNDGAKAATEDVSAQNESEGE